MLTVYNFNESKVTFFVQLSKCACLCAFFQWMKSYKKKKKKNNFIHHISSGEIIQGSKANFQLEKRERKEQVRESFDMLYKSVPK